MNHFDWTAWIIALAITIVFVIHTARVWNGKTSSGYAEGNNSVESINVMVKQFARGYVAISGIFVFFVILSVTRHEAQVITSQSLSDVIWCIFYLACVFLACSAVASVSLVFAGAPEFLVPPPLREH